MRYAINHTTLYEYREPAGLGHNLVHLEPRLHPRQAVHDYQLDVEPRPQVLTRRLDYFGNPLRYISVQEPHRRLCLSARSAVEVTAPPALDVEQSPPWEAVARQLRDGDSAAVRDAYAFVFDSPHAASAPALADYARVSFTPGRPLLAAARELTARIHHEFRYDKRATTIATPLHDVLDQRAGVCQDFAHVQIGCLRALGLAARYVSGYLVTEPPPGRPRLIGADASHAWLAVFCPVHGWIDFDPTNDQIPGDRHITLAWGRDYDDVSPVRGIVLGGGRSNLTVSVDVAPL